jgi:cysteine synthase B
LLEIHRITDGIPARVKVYAKLEGLNPGGSVKDRPAWRMVQEGLRSGKLPPAKPSSIRLRANTGIALAMIGSVLGYPVELVIPANVSNRAQNNYQRLRRQSDLSAIPWRVPTARFAVPTNHRGHPEKYYKPDQYFNPMNPEAHYENTGRKFTAKPMARLLIS